MTAARLRTVRTARCPTVPPAHGFESSSTGPASSNRHGQISSRTGRILCSLSSRKGHETTTSRQKLIGPSGGPVTSLRRMLVSGQVTSLKRVLVSGLLLLKMVAARPDSEETKQVVVNSN
jgi:hypothetical protein